MSRTVTLIAAALLATAITACVGGDGKAGGGGWIPSAVPGAKATFGFHASCQDNVGRASFSYKDHGAGVAFNVAQLTLDGSTHANTICSVDGAEEDGVPLTSTASFYGRYTPQPASAGPGGIVGVAFIDNGLAGLDADDDLAIVLEGGVYDGYINVQTLGHGQIQVRPE